MTQVSFELDEHDLAGLHRLMAKLRLSRPRTVVLILQEAVAANDEGRVAFAAKDGPKLDLKASELLVKLDGLTMDLERVFRVVADHERKLAKSMETNEESINIAERRIVEGIAERNRESYAPFVEKTRRLTEEVREVVAKLGELADRHQAETLSRLDRIEEWAKQPRTQRNLVFNDTSWSMGSLAASVLAVAGFSVLGFLFAAGQFGWGVTVASKMLDDPPRVCRMIERKYGAQDCRVPEPYRSLGLLANGRKR
jgi:hypothetical protein